MFEGLISALSSLRPFAWRTAFALFFLTSILIFLPISILDKIFLSRFAEESSTGLGLLWLLCVCVLAVELFEVLLNFMKGQKKVLKNRKETQRFLASLSSDEKAILKDYVAKDVSTVHFSIASGVANALEAKGILYRSSNLGIAGAGDLFPYSIQPVALDLLRKNPKLID